MYPQSLFMTGVRVAIDNLISALKLYHPEHEFIELRPAYSPRQVGRNDVAGKLFNHLQRIYWTQVDLPRLSRARRCDLLFCTCYFSPFVQALPTVTLFYDLAVWRHPEWYGKLWFLLNRVFAELPARRNAHVTTISLDAKTDLVNLLGLSEKQVSSIYLGVDLPDVPMDGDADVLRAYDVPPGSDYVLYMGAAIKHKNLPRLIEAFAKVCKALPDRSLLLIVAGPKSNLHGRDELDVVQQTIGQCGISDRVRSTGFVPREHCTILYRNAAAFAFPSLFEGFGLPVVEAMASGTPVVASNVTSLPEVGGDAAIYFDPYDVVSIASALHTVLTNPELSSELASRGRERAKLFTWRNAAAAYVELFNYVQRTWVAGR